MLNVETHRLCSPYGLQRAGDVSALWRAIGHQLQQQEGGEFVLMSFDTNYLPNGESVRIRRCPCLRYRRFDIVKSADGSFWYGQD